MPGSLNTHEIEAKSNEEMFINKRKSVAKRDSQKLIFFLKKTIQHCLLLSIPLGIPKHPVLSPLSCQFLLCLHSVELQVHIPLEELIAILSFLSQLPFLSILLHDGYHHADV